MNTGFSCLPNLKRPLTHEARTPDEYRVSVNDRLDSSTLYGVEALCLLHRGSFCRCSLHDGFCYRVLRGGFRRGDDGKEFLLVSTKRLEVSEGGSALCDRPGL